VLDAVKALLKALDALDHVRAVVAVGEKSRTRTGFAGSSVFGHQLSGASDD
jgi:hypothetical protein